MLQKNAFTEISRDTPGFYSNVFLVRIASGGWHPVIDLKQLNAHIYAPHFHMHTKSSVLNTVKRGDYAFKIRPAGCVLSHTNTSRQQEVPTFSLQNNVYLSVLSTSLRFENCPSGIYSTGAQSGCLPPLSGDIG